MKYEIYSYRYISSMSFVCTKNTQEEATKEIDRLAKLEKQNHKWYHGDPVYFTFMPVGDSQ